MLIAASEERCSFSPVVYSRHLSSPGHSALQRHSGFPSGHVGQRGATSPADLSDPRSAL